ncbi:tonsoku-like protein [Copidosoma floridanum]|uniref:tonsoku-like protein n=1 Tax=Copidosoma floridanum TaxID=29053 RepID=UPI0006C952EA|nr:tonsoku-like protein [Copidosoma floridanum]
MGEERALIYKRDKALKNKNENAKVLSVVQKKLGDIYFYRNNFDDALEAYQSQLEACEHMGDKLNCAIAHRLIGEVYFSKEKYEVALYHQNLYLDLALELKNLIEEQRAYATLGRTYLCIADNLIKDSEKDEKMKNVNEANRAFSKSIQLCEKLEGQISEIELMTMRARLLLNRGLVNEHKKKIEKALEMLNVAESLCEKYKLSEDNHRTKIALAGLYERYEHLKDLKLALKKLDEAANVEDANLKNTAHLLKAELLLRMGKWSEAKKLLLKLYKNEKLLEPDRQQVSKQLRKAVVLARNDLELSIETDDTVKEKIYETMGDAATAVRSFDKAIEYYGKMLSFAEKNQSSRVGAALTSLVMTFKDAGKFKDAIPYARRELALCTDFRDTCTSALGLAGILEDAGGDLEEIREMYDKALACAKDSNDLSLQKMVLTELLEYQRRINNQTEVAQLTKELDALPYIESQEIQEEDSPDVGADIDLDELSDSDAEQEQKEEEEKVMGHQLKNVSRHRFKRPRLFKPNEKGETPLHLACIKGDVSKVEYLLEEKHPTLVKDNFGWTPLHEASNHGFTEIVDLLIRHKADINNQCDGVTPLHDAAANGHFSVIRLLLENGADPNLLTKVGETALDCLEQWKERIDNLTSRDLKEYEDVRKKLMKITTVTSKKKKAKISSNRSRSALIDEDADDSDEIIAPSTIDTWEQPKKISMGEVYKQTIANLQPSNRLAAPLKPIHQLPKITAPLIDSDELLVNEWLEDDIGISHQGRERPYFNGVPQGVTNSSTNNIKRKSVTDIDVEIEVDKSSKRSKLSDESCLMITDESSNGSDAIVDDPFDTAIWPKTKKARQLSLFKQGFTKSNVVSKSPSPITVKSVSPEPAVYTSSLSRSEYERRSWESSMSETFDLEITLDGELFELKLHYRDLRKTMNDIEELIRHKFEAKTGCRPKIRFKTIEGVALSAEVTLEGVPKDKNKLKLFGEITQNELPPIADRYKKVCETLGVDVTDLMLKSLRSCENTSTFRLNTSNVFVEEELEPLIKCLHYQLNLQSINLSGATFFARGDLLNLTISKLSGLCELHLQGCDIDQECLEQVEKLPAALRVLDLSYNPLGSKSQEKLLKLIEPLERLQTLNLRACELDDFRFKFTCRSLINLDISWNAIGGDGAANLLQRQLLSLNLSNTLSNRSNVIDKLFFNESEGYSYSTLEYLDLSSCQATDFDVEKILSKTPNLTKLILNNNPNVTQTSLSAILIRKPTLNYIDLSGCKLIEDPPPTNLRIATPQVCTLLVHMNSLVVDSWEVLWQGKSKTKRLPDSFVIFKSP